MMLEEILMKIRPLDVAAMGKCQLRLDNLTKPLGSLHAFEHLACKLAGSTREARPCMKPPVIILMNGGRRTPGLLEAYARRVSAGILSFDVGEAGGQVAEQSLAALQYGIKMAGEAAAGGAQVIGIGVAGAVEEAAVARIMGRVCVEREDAVEAVRMEAEDPVEALMEVGDPVLAGLVGVILGAAASGAVVVLDGVLTALAAMAACRIAPQAGEYLVASHLSAEPFHAEVLGKMRLPAYLTLELNIGEGVGAALGISLIKASLHVLNDMKTFGEAEVSVAEDGPGALVQDRSVLD